MNKKVLRLLTKYKFVFLLFLAISLVSCDSKDSSSYTPSSTYSQPTTRTVDCPYCNAGLVLNPYDGNYYYCQNCGGKGIVTVSTGGSNPSFRGDNKIPVTIKVISCEGEAGSKCGCETYKGFRIAGTSEYVGKCSNYSGRHRCGHLPKAHGL